MCPADREISRSELPFTVTIARANAGGPPLQGAFAEVSGLGIEVQSGAFREGGENSVIHKLPDSGRLPSITFRRGVADQGFAQWMMQTQTNHRIPCDIVIVLRDEKRASVCEWRLTRAWPAKVNGPSLNARGDDVAIESLEVVFETLTLTEGGADNG